MMNPDVRSLSSAEQGVAGKEAAAPTERVACKGRAAHRIDQANGIKVATALRDRIAERGETLSKDELRLFEE